MARRRTSVSWIDRRPLVKQTAPASRSRPNSVISSPASPLVRAAAGWTLTRALSRAVFFTYSTSAISSITGSVSGIAMKVVTPPTAAARDADSKVSRCSLPGSPTNTRASTRPGTAVRPSQSLTKAPSGAPWFCASAPAARMRPSFPTMTVPTSSRLREGSTMRRFFRTSGLVIGAAPGSAREAAFPSPPCVRQRPSRPAVRSRSAGRRRFPRRSRRRGSSARGA
ncbi:hypothetical protein D9M68_153380 [compost metagenome]